MKPEDAIRKIKAALALAASGNQNEAATAARQARVLMDQYRIDADTLKASEVGEFKCKPGSGKPVYWEHALVIACANAYGSEVIFTRDYFSGDHWVFYAIEPYAELSAYAFDVLFRAVKKARREFMATHCKRMKVAQNKTRRADLYAAGWVDAVSKNLGKCPPNAAQAEAIEAFKAKRFRSIKELEARENKGRHSANDYQHYAKGRNDGKDMHLKAGVGGNANKKALGHL